MKRLIQLCVTALFLSLLASCAQPGADMSGGPLPAGTIQKGSLTNQKLRQDTTAGVFLKLHRKGHPIDGYHHIMPYVVSLPQGAPGSRRWTERWYVKVKEERIPVTINFKEDGADAADWEIRE